MTSRGALQPGGHHFTALEHQPRGVDTDPDFPPPPPLEHQLRYGMKRTYTMFLANYGQRFDVDAARCASRVAFFFARPDASPQPLSDRQTTTHFLTLCAPSRGAQLGAVLPDQGQQ